MDFINVLEAVNSFITWGWGAVSLPLTVMLWIHMVGDYLRPPTPTINPRPEECLALPEADVRVTGDMMGGRALCLLDFQDGTLDRQGEIQGHKDYIVILDSPLVVVECEAPLDVEVFESSAANDCRQFRGGELREDPYLRERKILQAIDDLVEESYREQQWYLQGDAWGFKSLMISHIENAGADAFCRWWEVFTAAPTDKVQATRARTQEVLGMLEDNDRPWERPEAHVDVDSDLVYETIPGHEHHLPLLEHEGRFYLKEPGGRLRPLMVPTSEELGS